MAIPPKTRGGKRPGSGAKKKQATILRELCIRENVQEAEKSLMFIKSIRDDVSKPDSLRVECAKELMDRIWGKAVQAVQHSGTVESKFVAVYHPSVAVSA